MPNCAFSPLTYLDSSACRDPLVINMDLIDDRAILDDEEDDESFDEDTGEVRQKSNGTNGRFDDSSDEEEDDDDEEAAAEVGHNHRVHVFVLTFFIRLQRGSLWMRTKRKRRLDGSGDANARNVVEKNAKMKASTRKTWS